jgi:DNA invertase Pin-like site-specific DNA recombinase
MPMSVGYARVSTHDQDLALQLDALHAAGCERIFTEKASGAQRDRPQLQAALDYMRADDTLVVWNLDRLARSLRQLLDTVEALHSRHIGLHSLTEAIDTGTPGGTLVFHLFGALAEFERSIIRERTRAGLAAARARGRTGGRPPAMSAADKQAARALLKDPAITVEDVAKRLQVSPATLYRSECRSQGPAHLYRHQACKYVVTRFAFRERALTESEPGAQYFPADRPALLAAGAVALGKRVSLRL